MTAPRGQIPRGQSLTARPLAPDLTGSIPTFMRYGACRLADPELFYRSDGDSPDTDAAKAVCAVCEVRVECLTYAVQRDEKHGIWGGMTRRERLTEARARRRGAA